MDQTITFRFRLLGVAALLVGGCALSPRDSDLVLEPRPPTLIRVPVAELNPPAPAQSVQQTRWRDQPEKLPPPVESDKDAPEAKEAKAANTARPPTDDRVISTPAPEPRVTLQQAIQLCILNDPKLKAGVEGITQSQAELVTASLKPNPTLDVGQTLMPLFRAFTVDNQGGPPQLDVGISYPIDWCLFGKRAAAMASARLGIDVSEFEYTNTLRERIGEVSLAFFDVLEARALVALAEQDVNNLGRIEKTLERAVKAGSKAQVDLDRIRLDRLKSEQALRDARSNLGTARARFQSFLGPADIDPHFDAEGTLEGEIVGGPLSVEELFASAVAQRPDLQAARAELARSEAAVLVEDRKGYPEVNPRAGYTHQFQRTTIGFADADAFGVGVSMTLPCHDRNQGNRIKARSQAVRKAHELQASQVELRAEIKRLVQEYHTAQANARAAGGEQLRLAGQVRDTVEKAYQAGSRTLLDLLDAQRNYRETYRLYVTSRAGYYRGVSRLYNATGAWMQK